MAVIELQGRTAGPGEGRPFVEEVERLFGLGQRSFVINLQGVTLVGSGDFGGGLDDFISLYNKLKPDGGRLKLAAMPKRIADIFHITKLDTVFETFADEASAITSFIQDGGRSRRQYSFAIIPDSDGRLRIEVLEKLDTVEVAETVHSSPALTTVWLPAASIFLQEEIDFFEELINAVPPATESAFQHFFEIHPKWLFLLGEQYEAAVSHAKLPPVDLNASLAFSAGPTHGMTLIPDFLLKRVGLDLWDVLDIKLPSTRTIVGRRSRRRFSLMSASASSS